MAIVHVSHVQFAPTRVFVRVQARSGGAAAEASLQMSPPPTAPRRLLLEFFEYKDDQGLYHGLRFTIDSTICVLFYGCAVCWIDATDSARAPPQCVRRLLLELLVNRSVSVR